MDNKTILEHVQKNKIKNGEYERSVGLRGGAWSTIITLFVMSILFFLELYAKGTYNVGIIATGSTLTGIDALYEGYKTKNSHLIIIGAIMSMIAFICILVFWGQVFGV